MVLQTLASSGPLHGYGVAARLERLLDAAGVQIEMRTLYPSIARLEQRGLIHAGSTLCAGRRATRCYAITPPGHRHLENATVEWERASSLITGVLREFDRHKRELAIAKEVQTHLFPQRRPAIAGLDYAGVCRPALEVGGDYYDFIPISKTAIGLAIGDVSGKGVSAALLMAALRALVRSQLMNGALPWQLTTRVNRLLYDSSAEDRYASLFYAEYDSTAGELTYVNAGHPPPVFLGGQRDPDVVRLEAGGPVLGLLPDCGYEQGCVRLASGSVLVAYTDGVTEARNRADLEWGEARLIAAASRHGARPAAELADRVMGEAERFALGAPRHDDMTTLVVRRVSG